jgi:signal transduction histidine kinase
MMMGTLARRPWHAWASVGLLAILCGVLAVVQYRWVGELAVAERSRLREELQSRLSVLSRNFNEEITRACIALLPDASSIEERGRERAYGEKYLAWRETHDALFRRIGLAVPQEDGGLGLLLMDLSTGQFASAPWPQEWKPMEERLAARSRGNPVEPFATQVPTMVEFPRFAPRFPEGRFEGGGFRGRGRGGEPGRGGPPEPGPSREPGRFEPGGPPMREAEWFVGEFNLDYIDGVLLPEYFNHYLGTAGHLEYEVQVVSSADPSQIIYAQPPGSPLIAKADAIVPLLDLPFNLFSERGRGRGRGGRGGRGFRGMPAGANTPGQGRWTVLVRHHAGSLEALVTRTRRRNLAVSGGVLLLILATVGLLVRFTRRAQQLAHLQMNFVAGVSHELRTPLTVIRTAAFNLRGRMSHNAEQVERYGALIQSESERLEALVEQVLSFASMNAGHVIRAREPVALDNIIEDSLRSSRVAIEGSHLQVERRIEDGLPLVLADETALRHAIQNLIDNAVKYGIEGSNWIGLFASLIKDGDGSAVEIRVADRGPGIPADEQDQVFEPFFRGRRAIQDQVHGTGLGLNLVKQIIEAHGGSIHVKSHPMEGTEFIVRIPAAPPEMQDEFANTVS